MFWKTLQMEIRRSCSVSRAVPLIFAITGMMLLSDWEYMWDAVKYGYTQDVSSIAKLHFILVMDQFKCIIVVMLCGIYTNSFCKDSNSHYLRMILNRTSVTVYTQCRFIANGLVITLASVCSFYLYILLLRPWFPLLNDVNEVSGYFYKSIVVHYPIVYVGMMGLIFGMAAAACSSVGLLYSAYSANSFVSIAISGLVFFAALSYIPFGNPFNVLTLVSMGNTLGREVPWPFMFLWGMIYMIAIIGICGVLFCRRMKWRMKNGFL